MKVKDIIATALRFVGRDEISKKLLFEPVQDGAGGETAEETPTETTPAEEPSADPNELTAEEKEVVDTLLYCFNSVEDELARCYIPLRTLDVMSSESGVYPFSDFKLRPVKIISVKAHGKNVKYSVNAQNLITDCTEITVEYGYAPLKKGLEDESEFSSVFANERLVAAGTASEYCLIDGEAKLAECWESVYRGEIDAVQRTRLSGLRLPPRRWV